VCPFRVALALCGNIRILSKRLRTVMKKSHWVFVLAATGALALSALAVAPARADTTIKQQAQDAGHAVSQDAKHVGHSIASHSRKLGHTVARTSREVGHSVARNSREAGHAIARDSKAAGRAIAEKSRAAGHAMANGAHKTKAFIENPPPAKTTAN
jgi:gas vesicle protein